MSGLRREGLSRLYPSKAVSPVVLPFNPVLCPVSKAVSPFDSRHSAPRTDLGCGQCTSSPSVANQFVRFFAITSGMVLTGVT